MNVKEGLEQSGEHIKRANIIDYLGPGHYRALSLANARTIALSGRGLLRLVDEAGYSSRLGNGPLTEQDG